MRTQLTWARQAGISFFVFDWYYNPDPGNGPINMAHDNYVRLRAHQGVGFALLYVNQDVFVIPRNDWAAAVEKWARADFTNPDYVRVDGKPLLVILDSTAFREEWGGPAGVNEALSTLRDAAKRHGLPGVFVAGARYTDWLNFECFPTCEATDGGPQGLVTERYDAVTDFAYPWAVEPVDGARPYGDVVAAEKRNLDRFGQTMRVPYIPTVMDGWDPRPWNERYGGFLLTWFTRSPAEVRGFVKDAVDWAALHPLSSSPIVLMQSWNELGEGAYVLPTDEDGYTYLQAIADAVRLPWSTVHSRRIVASIGKRGTIAGRLAVDDGWTPCDVERLSLQRQTARGWLTLRAFATKPGGAFSVALPARRGRYRLTAPRTIRYQQTCGAAKSVGVPR